MLCNNSEQLADGGCCGCVQMATRTKGRSCQRRRVTRTSWRRSSTARTLMWTACCLKVLSVTSLSVCLSVCLSLSLYAVWRYGLSSLSLSLSLSVTLCCLKVWCLLSLYAVCRYGLSPLSLSASVPVSLCHFTLFEGMGCHLCLSIALSVSLVTLCCLKVWSVASVTFISVALCLLSLYAVWRYGLSPPSLCCSVCVSCHFMLSEGMVCFSVALSVSLVTLCCLKVRSVTSVSLSVSLCHFLSDMQVYVWCC